VTLAEMTRKKQTENYVNNKEFLAAIVMLRDYFERGKKLGHENYRVTIKYFRDHQNRKIASKFRRCHEYLGACFSKIAIHLSYKPNFVNYMFRDDMICDGVENCIQYILNFDPEKSTNPFAYFTQIIYYAFLRRIQKEKKQLEIKGKILERLGYDEVMHTDIFDGTMSYMNASYSDMGTIKETIENRMNR
jgi:hypothetical protein